jgi:integrase
VLVELDLTERPSYNRDKLLAYDAFQCGWCLAHPRHKTQATRPIVLFVCHEERSLLGLTKVADETLTGRIGLMVTPAEHWYFPGREHMFFALNRPLRVIVRRSIDNDELLVDPCARLKMPVVRNARTRIEPSTTAEALIAALPESEQAFWALALFAGVRRGELRGLQVDDIDFDAGLVHVRRGWDDVEGEIDPKTFAGARDIPMVGELRRICRAHRLQTGRNGAQLFLGRTPADPFYPSTIRARALKAWGWRQVPNPNPGPRQTIWIKARSDALEPLTPHEARHRAASYMIAAGMDWKKITEFIGHSDVRTTYNRYGKVVPEDLAPAAAQLDEYLDRGRAARSGSTHPKR